jgi:hypothetical protein
VNCFFYRLTVVRLDQSELIFVDVYGVFQFIYKLFFNIFFI